jgi:hypothetical protein
MKRSALAAVVALSVYIPTVAFAQSLESRAVTIHEDEANENSPPKRRCTLCFFISSESAIADAKDGRLKDKDKDKDEVLDGDDLHAKTEGATRKTITQFKGEI